MRKAPDGQFNWNCIGFNWYGISYEPPECRDWKLSIQKNRGKSGRDPLHKPNTPVHLIMVLLVQQQKKIAKPGWESGCENWWEVANEDERRRNNPVYCYLVIHSWSIGCRIIIFQGQKFSKIPILFHHVTFCIEYGCRLYRESEKGERQPGTDTTVFFVLWEMLHKLRYPRHIPGPGALQGDPLTTVTVWPRAVFHLL